MLAFFGSATATAAGPSTLAVRALAVLSGSLILAVTLVRKWRPASRISDTRSMIADDARIILAIDIGSSSVRCSAYTIGSPPVAVQGCAMQIKHPIVGGQGDDSGTADANVVVDLVERAVDGCFRELRARRVSNAVVTVGFACFGMNLVGVDIEGRPCTPVFTYANSSPKLADVVKRLRHALDTTGNNREGVQEEFRQRTGAPVHVSYAAAALLQWLAVTATTSAPSPEHKVEQKRAEGERESDWRNDGYFDADSGCAKAANHSLSSTGDARNVKVWQTLPSLIAARWCGMTSAPVSYSEASWMGLLDFRKLEWDGPTLSVLREAGFDSSTLPPLSDIEGLRARVCGAALKRWPELHGASVRLGVGDGAAACLGSGCNEASGLIAATVGTSAAARVVLEVGSTTTAAVGTNESVDTEGATTAAAAAAAAEAFSVPKGLWCYRLDRYRVVLGGSLTDGGSVFDWLRHTLALGNNCVDDMNSVMREVEEMSPGSHELVVLPFFSGERSPGYNDAARACILGLTRSTTRAQLMRAGMESVCLRLAAVIDLMSGVDSHDNSTTVGANISVAPQVVLNASLPHDQSSMPGNDYSAGAPADRKRDTRRKQEAAADIALSAPNRVREDAKVVTSGNAMAASPFWQQILADCLGRTVQASGTTEETSLGVAVLLSSLEEPESSVTVTDSCATRGIDETEGRGPAASSDELKQAGESVAAAATASTDVSINTPNDEAFRAYRRAGRAQARAYRAFLGTGDESQTILSPVS